MTRHTTLPAAVAIAALAFAGSVAPSAFARGGADDPVTHHVGDDNGTPAAGHDVGDDKGTDAVGHRHHRRHGAHHTRAHR